MLQSRLYTGIAILNPQKMSESAACKHRQPGKGGEETQEAQVLVA